MKQYDGNPQKASVKVTEIRADSLLRGAFYALEQAWNLLYDAVGLYQKRRYANSLVLSVFCLEEQGRAEIYLNKRKLALQSGRVNVQSLRKQCQKHEVKLNQGQIPVTAVLFGFGEPPSTGSAEEAKVAARLRKVRQVLEERAPREAHENRFRALYVDPGEDGKRWNRPSKTISEEDADKWLGAALVGYERLRGQLVESNDAELAGAVLEWKSRPELPEPPWDPLTWD